MGFSSLFPEYYRSLNTDKYQAESTALAFALSSAAKHADFESFSLPFDPQRYSYVDFMIADTEGTILVNTSPKTEKKLNIEQIKTAINSPIYGPSEEDYIEMYPLEFKDKSAILITRAKPQHDSTLEFYLENKLWWVDPAFFILFFYLMSRKKMAEIEEISAGLSYIMAGNLRFKIPVKSKDEIGQLATHINQLTANLLEEKEREKRVEQEKEELIANISHDLRTPLTSVIGYLEILQSGRLQSEQEIAHTLAVLNRKTMQIKHLTDSLFEYATLNKEQALLKESICLNHLLAQKMDEYQEIAALQGIEFTADLPPDLLFASVNVELFVRALDNLFGNAIKHSAKPGRISLRLWADRSASYFSITNPCSEITRSDQHRLFERFFKVDKTRTSAASGCGLGLAIVKSIIEMHQGTIEAVIDGTNITFTLMLPAEQHP